MASIGNNTFKDNAEKRDLYFTILNKSDEDLFNEIKEGYNKEDMVSLSNFYDTILAYLQTEIPALKGTLGILPAMCYFDDFNSAYTYLRNQEYYTGSELSRFANTIITLTNKGKFSERLIPSAKYAATLALASIVDCERVSDEFLTNYDRTHGDFNPKTNAKLKNINNATILPLKERYEKFLNLNKNSNKNK